MHKLTTAFQQLPTGEQKATSSISVMSYKCTKPGGGGGPKDAKLSCGRPGQHSLFPALLDPAALTAPPTPARENSAVTPEPRAGPARAGCPGLSLAEITASREEKGKEEDEEEEKSSRDLE